MNSPTEAQFVAAFEASQKDYEDRLHTLDSAISSDMELKAQLRCYILGFLGHRYDSRLRVYLKRLTKHSDKGLLESVESMIVEELLKSGGLTSKVIRVEQPIRPLSPRAILLTGVGAAVGGAAVAMTAGLAAPIILPSIAAALGSAALAGGTGVTAIAAMFGAAGAGWSGYKVSKHFHDISDMTLHPISRQMSSSATTTSSSSSSLSGLGLNICVSGWYTDRADLLAHWSFMPSSTDSVVLEYEAELMESLGNLWEELAMSTVAGIAVNEVLRATVVGTALAAIAWPLALLQIGSMVDHPWWLAVGRSKKCGEALARMLASRGRSFQGARPVCLYGVSMGAIVVQHCLEELARLGAFGIVEDVVLLGLPAKLPSQTRLLRMRKVVAGRFVHGFSRKDWLLRFLFRTTRLHVGEVAGLAPWDIEGIESVDLTNLINNHTEYRDRLEEIFDLLNLV